MHLNASYPVTDRNLLSLTAGVGYEQYFQHDEWSDWFLQSGSELSFDMYVKDFWFNFHERFSYSQDAAQQADVANATEYVTITNTAGLLTTWDLQDVTLSLGYDHQNYWYPNQEYQDRATELILTRPGLRVHPRVTTGVEGTVSLTSYDEKVLNDNAGYSAGVYADWQPGPWRAVNRGGQTKNRAGAAHPPILTQ